MIFRHYLRRHTATLSLGVILVFFRKRAKSFLVVLVMTGPTHEQQRDTLRETWLSMPIPEVTHLFPVGTGMLGDAQLSSLRDEQSRYGDLLLLPHVNDTYATLTRKLLASFEWLDENMEFAFVLKADDDSYVRLDMIERELRARDAGTGAVGGDNSSSDGDSDDSLYWGFFDGRASVKRRGKWAERDWVLCDTYLPYARGGGYVLGARLVHFVAPAAGALRLYRSEDAALGAWVTPVRVHRVHDPRFDTEYRSRGCNNAYIITHKQDRASLLQKHRNLETLGRLCRKEFRTRYSYVYNWHVAPSQCCVRNDTSIP